MEDWSVVVADQLTEAQWRQYDEQGYLKLGKILTDHELAAMQQRIDDIMLGNADVDYTRMTMQIDRGAMDYAEALTGMDEGYKGKTLAYRKIEQLEFDPIFLGYMQRPLFRQICADVYGPRTRIACHRAMFFNKPAGKGSVLPWHQDAWQRFDRPPLVTIWLALDQATVANGCVQLIPGSHKQGVINSDQPSGFLTEAMAVDYCKDEDLVFLELEAGEAALLHNWTLHRSHVNRTNIPRRAFSVNYMDADTVDQRGHTQSVIFGDGALHREELPNRATD